MTCSKIHATLFYDDIRILLATYFNLNVCREITYYTYSVLERVFDTFHIIYIYIVYIHIYLLLFTICCMGIDCLSYPTLQWHNGEIYFPNKIWRLQQSPVWQLTCATSVAWPNKLGPSEGNLQQPDRRVVPSILASGATETNRSYLRTRRLSLPQTETHFRLQPRCFTCSFFVLGIGITYIICLDAYDALACCL